jgi:hypothetical protein
MCRHYLGHRLGAFEKCAACGMYGPIGRNGGGCGCAALVLVVLAAVLLIRGC